MSIGRRRIARAMAVCCMGVVALARVPEARADDPSLTICNTYCWYDCGAYAVSACMATGCVAGWSCSNFQGACASYGLSTIVCFNP